MIVLVDAMRADHVGCYGYTRATSPAIDALAADATRFEQAFTTAPWTLPAMSSLWTSLYPSVHGATQVTDFWQRAAHSKLAPVSVLADAHVTLAEILRQSGFRTAAFTNGAYPARIFGMDQGFDQFEDDRLPGERLNVEALLAWIDRNRKRRFFAYLHAKGPHSPYQARMPEAYGSPNDSDPERRRWFAVLTEELQRWHSFDFDPGYVGPVDGSFENLGRMRTWQLPQEELRDRVAICDQGIRYADYWIGELMKGLRERALYDNTVIVVLADHGEELFDHGGLEHSKTFYEEVMRIPLVVRVPHAQGNVLHEQVSMVDVLPTLLESLGLPPLSRAQGRSLLPLFEGGHLPDSTVFGDASIVSGRRAVRRPNWKYINTPGAGGEELYDLAADPHERTNLCARERCEPFLDELMRWEDAQQRKVAELGLPRVATAAVDENVRERLRQSGYAH